MYEGYHHVDTCRQEDQVCIGFFDGLEASATDHMYIHEYMRTLYATLHTYGGNVRGNVLGEMSEENVGKI